MSAADRTSAMIVAIDGPAGSGKSTTAREVARRLGFRYLDTGAMYRAITLAVVREGLESGLDQVDALVQRTTIDFREIGGVPRVYLDGVEVTDEIRTPQINRLVSEVSARPTVRQHLVAEQRRLAQAWVASGQGVVLDGRDIGTHVFPDAAVKVYLVADMETRAHRRTAELREGGGRLDVQSVREELERRDETDSTRAHAPLRKASDAVELDTSNLSVDQQVDAVIQLVRERSRTDSV